MMTWFLHDHMKLPALSETEFINKENYAIANGMCAQMLEKKITVDWKGVTVKGIH